MHAIYNYSCMFRSCSFLGISLKRVKMYTEIVVCKWKSFGTISTVDSETLP